jgi:hypothetical protein
MVAVAQLVESRIVIPVVVGSSPISHPNISPARVKQTASFLLHHAAFEQRGPKNLESIYVILQAALFEVLNQVLHGIMRHGVTVVTPALHDKGWQYAARRICRCQDQNSATAAGAH